MILDWSSGKDDVDRIAIVTGGTRGIGLAIATRLALTHRLILTYQGDDVQADNAFHTLRVKTNGLHVRKVDTRSQAQVKRLVAEFREKYTRIDVLVNNAGITRDTLLPRMTEEHWDDVLDTNLKGAFLCSQAVLAIMAKNGYGRIVNIASVVGQTGNKGQANYAASKGGLISLTKSLAREYGSVRRNITVNAVAPGFIHTRMTDVLPESFTVETLNNTPLGRFGTPDDIAGAVVFLVGPDAGFITGHVLNVNGGLHMD